MTAQKGSERPTHWSAYSATPQKAVHDMLTRPTDQWLWPDRRDSV
jgi:hypothetical protein